VFQVHKQLLNSVEWSVYLQSDNVELDLFANTNHKNQWNREELTLMNSVLKQDTMFSLNWQNFHKRWLKTEEFYQKNSEEYSLLLKWMMLAKVKDYFGESIDFYKDILPVLNGEYIFNISENLSHWMDFNFISQYSDESQIEKLVLSFVNNRWQFTVEEKQLKLNEDLILSKVVSNESKIEKINEFYKWFKIKWYNIKNKPWWLYYTTQKWYVYVATSIESSKSIVYSDISNNNLPNHLYL